MAHLGSQVAHLGERRVSAPGPIKELGVWMAGRALVGGHLRIHSHLARIAPHLVEEVRMDKGTGWIEAVGGGPYIWPEAHIWKTLGRRGHIWAEGHSRRGISEGG